MMIALFGHDDSRCITDEDIARKVLGASKEEWESFGTFYDDSEDLDLWGDG